VGDAVQPRSPAPCPEASALRTCGWSGLVASGSQLIHKGENQFEIHHRRLVVFGAR